MNPHLQTPFTAQVGVRYPVMQTGMGWVAGARLASATTNAGGLGVLATATMSFPEMREAVASVQARTTGPFGVNVRGDMADIGERISFLLDAGIRVVSFASVPVPELVDRLRGRDVFVICTVGAPRHARKVAAMGVNAVIAQGGEGGGHTGQIPTSLLLPSVVDAVGDQLVVLGAGGFQDGRGLVAAMAYGADGIAMGTRFLLSRESRVPDDVKHVYLETSLTGTRVTTRIDGAPQRVIATPVIERLEGAGRLGALPRSLSNAWRFSRQTRTPWTSLVRQGLAMKRQSEMGWAQVVMAANAPMMTKAALVDGRTDVGILPTGQVAGSIEELPTVAEIIDSIVDDASSILDQWALDTPGDRLGGTR